MRVLVLAVLVSACGARTELDQRKLDASLDASVDAIADASVDAIADARVDVVDAHEELPPPLCDFGVVVAGVDTDVRDWNGGAPLPAGHYRVTYVDGCMKYSSGQGWTVNAYAEGTGPDAYWLVTGPASTKLHEPPGTVGFFVDQGAFASFTDCVTANGANDAPLEFDFAGGTLGVQLADSPTSDNVPGESGRNPTWRLSACP